MHFCVSVVKGRFIMGNKLARTIVFFYTIILHVLVFLVCIMIWVYNILLSVCLSSVWVQF